MSEADTVEIERAKPVIPDSDFEDDDLRLLTDAEREALLEGDDDDVIGEGDESGKEGEEGDADDGQADDTEAAADPSPAADEPPRTTPSPNPTGRSLSTSSR
jgi:hypothetical protein